MLRPEGGEALRWPARIHLARSLSAFTWCVYLGRARRRRDQDAVGGNDQRLSGGAFGHRNDQAPGGLRRVFLSGPAMVA